MGYSGSRRQHNNGFWWVRTSCGMYRTESGEVVVAHGEDPLLALMGRGRSAKGFSGHRPCIWDAIYGRDAGSGCGNG